MLCVCTYVRVSVSVCFVNVCVLPVSEGDGYLKNFFEKTASLNPAERADFLGEYEVQCANGRGR